jgi:hypothetical protein
MAWLGLRARPAGGRHAQGTRLEPIIARCENPIQAGTFARKTTGSEPVLTGLLSALAGHRDLLSGRTDVRPKRETRREKLAATPRRASASSGSGTLRRTSAFEGTQRTTLRSLIIRQESRGVRRRLIFLWWAALFFSRRKTRKIGKTTDNCAEIVQGIMCWTLGK